MSPIGLGNRRTMFELDTLHVYNRGVSFVFWGGDMLPCELLMTAKLECAQFEPVVAEKQGVY